jgi:hypothetical protein
VKDGGSADLEEIVESDTDEGGTLDISMDENKLISSLSSEPERTLDELLEGITKDNIPAEVDTGIRTGGELLVIARAYAPESRRCGMAQPQSKPDINKRAEDPPWC